MIVNFPCAKIIIIIIIYLFLFSCYFVGEKIHLKTIWHFPQKISIKKNLTFPPIPHYHNAINPILITLISKKQ